MSDHRSAKDKNKAKVSDSRRWIYQDDDEADHQNDADFDEYDEDLPPQHVLDSDEDDNVDYKLIRTEPKIDSFDVEALEIPGFQRNDYKDVTMGKSIMMALQMLGVVFGDVGTSPLYTFSVMFSKAPVNGDEDVIGALSLVLYTLILIPSFKYVLIVLLANDDGEGGTFALYSLICRHANVSLLPNQQPSDTRLSSFRLKVPSPELERSLKIKECLEASLALKKLLLILVLAGTSMVIADGVVTPAMSVMSAVGGLKLGATGIKQDQVVMISVAFLVVLFSVQRYATSKVGIVIGPALLIWFFLLGTIGVYNLIKYDSSVLKAFNPVHIYYFFVRNSTKAWYSLGGCLLCATGSEAMFADLCHFSVRSVQFTFAFLVLPCLLLGYLGQAAYLMSNHADTTQAFFASTPSWAFWPVLLIANIAALIASRTMTTATFSCIKQSTALGCFPRLKIIHTSRKYMGKIYIPVLNWFLLACCLVLVCSISNIYEIGNAYGIAEVGVMMVTTILVTLVMLLIWQIKVEFVVSFAIIFLGMELTFFSSVLWSVWDGSWIILVFAVIMFLVMFIWNYGSKLKYESEVKEKISIDLMRQLGSNLGTVRAPGIGLLYNELVKGVPAIFGQFLTTLPAVHSMIIFVCIKYIPVPLVPQDERFLFRRVCPRSYHIFRCIARQRISVQLPLPTDMATRTSGKKII
ncbi:potassium transporter 7 isoform X2 [Daucus carota subsp. sativus]|uniref:potassium transporter 7 isoform X2 n=1 Tax=Daucus carota subsp. sativus TaxID=79200 RepID=UPI0007EF34D1|nr:PREDICTED: potassium transporter 7-like isoform X2 [Daucus carota subsp. sativus]